MNTPPAPPPAPRCALLRAAARESQINSSGSFIERTQLKLSLCRVAVQDAMVRGLTEYLEAPLKAVLDFCDGIDTLANQRKQLLLDYDHHKRKHEAVEVRGGNEVLEICW